MLRLLIGTDWTANRDRILDRIREDVKNARGGRILMVPELISHEAERRLSAVAGDTSSRYAQVLSFTRLARRVSDEMGGAMECLDNGGRVVAMAAAARQLSSRLKAYASVETRPEFLTGLIEAVDELKRCCITADDLRWAARETQGSFAQKLEELALLMESYDGLCARGKRDPRDQETQLLEQMEAGTFARRHVFYIDGFPDFTRQHMAILEHLIRESEEVTITLNCDGVASDRLAFEKAGATARELQNLAKQAGVETKIEWVTPGDRRLLAVCEKLFQGHIDRKTENPGSLRVYHSESAYDACMGAAEEVARLVREGCRYRDISIVVTDPSVYRPVLELIFRRMGIPLYISGTEDILQKSVVATVLNALEAALSGFDRRGMLRYLRSALSPLEPDLCDEVENYVIVWNIRGSQWLQPWENHPDGLSGQWNDRAKRRLAVLNQARETVCKPLERLRAAFARGEALESQVRALYAFLEEIRLRERLQTMAEDLDAAGENRGAQIANQLWEILLSALEQLYDVLGQTQWEPEYFTRLLRLLLSQYDVGTIPPVLDAVQAGPVSAMRCNQEKHLLILGCEEGKLPGYSGSAGILTDQERVALRALGLPLTGGAMEGIQEEFAEIYGVFCGAMETVSVWYSGDQPSFVCRRLSQFAGEIRENSSGAGFAQADRMEAGAYLAAWNAGADARALGLEEQYDEICRRRDYTLGTVARERIDALYGTTLNLSASQVDRQAECRLSYFLRYGLRVQERREATVDPAEFGTYVHAVLENTARHIRDRGGFHEISLEETMEIAHRYSDEYAAEHFSQLDSQRMEYLFQRNMQELDHVVRELWTELKDSLFEPVDFEVGFGTEDGLPAIEIPNGATHAILRGFIDRVDTWSAHGNTYYRVVDYKTGKKDFDYCDVFNGVGLQMLLYLFALRDSGAELLGDRPVAAGVQYFPARAPFLSADGSLEEEEAQKERRKEWKRRGILLEDEEILQAMEPGEEPQRMCYSRGKDGTLRGDLMDRDQIRLMERHVFSVLRKLVEEIVSGNVEPNPYTRGSSHDACAFCPYGAICRKSTVTGRRNYKMMQPRRFWEEVEKEVGHNG